MTLEIIREFHRLLEFEPEWSSVARASNGLTPFQLPEWLLAWWRHFGSGQLRVLVFRQSDAVIAVLPCFLHEWQQAQQMTLIGSGISDYLNPLMAPQHSSAVVKELRAYLASDANWEICNWQDLSFDTPLESLASKVEEDAACYRLALTDSFEQYWSERSKSLRQNVRRDRQKAESQAPLRFDVSTTADTEAMHALIQLHASRWQKQGERGMIEANQSAAFLQEITSLFAARGMLRIFSLRFREKIAAIILAFEYAGTLFNYLTAFDPEHEALGLGRALLYEALRDSFERRCAAWDFLRGDEPYKIWWGARRVPKCRVIVTRTT